MDILTIGAVVRSFASLLMSDSMGTRSKQALVLGMAVVIFDCYTAAHGNISVASMFDATMNGLTAGLTALGVYHLTSETTTQPSVSQVQEG